MGALSEKYGGFCRLKALMEAVFSVPKYLFKGLSKIIVKSYIKKNNNKASLKLLKIVQQIYCCCFFILIIYEKAFCDFAYPYLYICNMACAKIQSLSVSLETT